MAKIAVQQARRIGAMGPKPPSKVSPFKEIGTSGVAVFGGQIISREKDPRVFGQQRWLTYGELVTNTSIVAAGVRYFLGIVAASKWTLEPADESDEAKKNAEFVESVINSMETPWRRVVRRAAMYRFNGYGIQEWTAKKREKDGKIGLDDVEARPCHTMDHWEVDERGTVTGIWQRSPQTGQLLWLPRQKIMYMVEDSVTDSPEGLGLYRHLVDPYLRLMRYQNLEGLGFDRDMRGIPIGRVPYGAIARAVAAGTLTDEEGKRYTSAVESFVKMQTKSEDTSIVLDSAPYVVETQSGQSISGVMQYGLELLQGQQPGFADLNNALARLNREMARIIGVEHLLLGESAGSRALSEDKSRNFYLTTNGSLDEVADSANKDIVTPICDLNGIKEDMRPKLKHSDVSFRAVTEITQALQQLATAGAVMMPDDPAVDEVRDMLGLSKSPEMTPEQKGLIMGAPQLDPNKVPGQPGAPPKPGFPPKPGTAKPGAKKPLAGKAKVGQKKGGDTGSKKTKESVAKPAGKGSKVGAA